MTRPTRTVYSTLPLEVGTIKHPVGTPLHVFEGDADTLIAEGRATATKPGEVAPAKQAPVQDAPPAKPAAASPDA